MLNAAQSSGADAIVLCDTNGGSLPMEIVEIVKDVREKNKGYIIKYTRP